MSPERWRRPCGTIADGTYVLTAQTYYAANCPKEAISATAVIAGDCLQEVAGSAAAPQAASLTARLSVQGNHVTVTPTCAPAGTTADAPTETFTASGTTLTLYTANAAAGNGNPDRVEVLTRQ